MGKSRRADTTSERNDRETIQKQKEIIRNQLKEIARLNKELDRRTDVSADYQELLKESSRQTITVFDSALPSTENQCPECSAGVNYTEIGIFTLQTCTMCNWRKRVRSEE